MEDHTERHFVQQAELRSHPAIKGAHPEAKKMLLESAIDPNDFLYTRGYTPEGIKRDLDKLQIREGQFEMDDSEKSAEVFEAIVLDQGERSDWFGPNAETIKTSRFDDVMNGIDVIIEFANANEQTLSHLGLAVDVTLGTMSLQKKIERIKKEIDSGNLAGIEYFRSEKEGVSERRKVARVVVGVELEQVIELTALWLQQKNLKYKDMRSKANKAMGIHPAQRVILEEITIQLEVFKKYSDQNNHPALAVEYEKDLAIVRALIAEKEKNKIGFGGLADDKVFNGISKTLERVFWSPDK